MKKFIYLALWATLVLTACWQTTTKQTENLSKTTSKDLTCSKYFTISWVNQQNLILQAKVVSSKIKNIVSNNAWIVSYLNCQAWQKVTKNTLIAKIIPDWQDPNVKNLLDQKKSLQIQILNLKSIISSTKRNFSSQLNSLNTQKANLENQIKFLEQNLANLTKQKKYWVGDLQTQIKSLETQLQDLEKSKSKLEQSKQAEIEKLNQNIQNTIASAKSLTKNVLLKVDEIYGITNENKHKNDAFENYLSAKNTALKEKIKNEFMDLSTTKVTNWSNYLQKMDNFVRLVKSSIKASVTSRTLTQTMIDTWYSIFDQYDNWLINLKNSLDSLQKSLEAVKNNYDNQILNLQTQINTVKNSIENLKTNKLSSYISSIDIQINQTKSQLDASKSNLKNIISQIQSLKSQENIQIKQLENQLSSLESDLNQVNINLSPQKIYAQINGKIKLKKVSVWNKVWPNNLLCQIIPDKASLKLQVFWNLWNNLWEISFKDDKGQVCKLKVVAKLPYKDPITQNNIYETESIKNCNVSEGEVLTVNYKQFWNPIKIQQFWSNSAIHSKFWKSVYIPLDFVINELVWQKVKLFCWKKCVKYQSVELGNIDGEQIEVLSWLKIGEVICR